MRDKDINLVQKYCLKKYGDILRFLLHRDMFLHVAAVGTPDESSHYMRQKLEKLKNRKYEHQYSNEIISNLHHDASSIAWYLDDWKLLYSLKMFPHKPLSEISVRIQQESFIKYTDALKSCAISDEDPNENPNGNHYGQSNGNQSGTHSEPQLAHNQNGANSNDNSDDIEMREVNDTAINGIAVNGSNVSNQETAASTSSNQSVSEDSTQNERKRKSPESAPDDPLKSPRKRRKTSNHNHTPIHPTSQPANAMNLNPSSNVNRGLVSQDAVDGKYTPRQLCPDQEFLNNDQKSAIFKVFEHTALIESVWHFSRKSFINAFIQKELDLPTISGLQTCMELAWSVLPRFVDLPEDIAGDFDDILTLYKDFNKERVPRSSRAQFSSSLLAHRAHAAAGGTASDDDQPNGHGTGVSAHNGHGSGHQPQGMIGMNILSVTLCDVAMFQGVCI